MAKITTTLPSGSGGTSQLLVESFTYTSGPQIFTLNENYYQIYSIEVQGQGSLNPSQYNLISLNEIEILDPLVFNDYVTIIYGTASVFGFVPYYSQSVIDNMLLDKQDNISLTTIGTSGPSTLINNVLNIPDYIGGNESLLIRVSAEDIPSNTPVAIINNLAYKFSSSNPSHISAFVGFSTTGTLFGENCIIKQIGEVYLFGWGLNPNQHYLAGVNGTLITENLSETNFTKIIGYATDSNTLQIIKDFTTINK